MLAHLDPFLKTWRWPALALAAALFMLGAAHAFETFALLLPCPLCLRQREVYWAVVAISGCSASVRVSGANASPSDRFRAFDMAPPYSHVLAGALDLNRLCFMLNHSRPRI